MLAVFLPIGYQTYFAVDSIIGIDVNPSIEIRTNRADKVLSVVPLNDDALVILDGMNLKNVDLDVAVNALIGSMLKNGYVDDIKNSILITVENGNTEKGAALQLRLTNDINAVLDANALNGAVISQTVGEDERLRRLAGRHGISIGKAALVDLLVSQDERLQFADIAQLSINEINLLFAARQTALPGVTVSGQASSGAYIGDASAKIAAMNHANVSEQDATVVKTKLDYDDGHMVYEVRFYTADAEYEYEIDALSGVVVSCDRDVRRQSTPQEPQVSAPNTFISEEKAKAIALTHANLAASSVTFIKVHLNYDDGRPVYDVEFYSGNVEYDYEIDAVTGEIREYDREIESFDVPRHKNSAGITPQPPATQDTTAVLTAPTASTPPVTGAVYISEAQAKAIALAHAQLTESSVVFITAHLEYDDHRAVYDVEFYSGNVEYDYEVDAITGVIREFDRDIENYSIPHGSGQTSAGQAGNTDIGAEAAKVIVLAHAGLAESDVVRIQIERDREDGRIVYEVEFERGRMEYQYEIDAATGAILEWDRIMITTIDTGMQIPTKEIG